MGLQQARRKHAAPLSFSSTPHPSLRADGGLGGKHQNYESKAYAQLQTVLRRRFLVPSFEKQLLQYFFALSSCTLACKVAVLL